MCVRVCWPAGVREGGLSVYVCMLNVYVYVCVCVLAGGWEGGLCVYVCV